MESARRALAEENFRNINEARRNFLKYIFHELRSPLNSLTIGIEILEKSEDLKEADLESLGLMKDASTFMSDTLNNVLSIQKIEEGSSAAWVFVSPIEHFKKPTTAMNLKASWSWTLHRFPSEMPSLK
jgi:signal transduction histidine kinase